MRIVQTLFVVAIFKIFPTLLFPLESVESASGPVTIVLDRSPGVCIGVSLLHIEHEGQTCFQVDHVRPMSAADRFVDNDCNVSFFTKKNQRDEEA